MIVDSPKPLIYDAHFTALEKELELALRRGDRAWVKSRLEQHELMLREDPHLPSEIKPRARAVIEICKGLEGRGLPLALSAN